MPCLLHTRRICDPLGISQLVCIFLKIHFTTSLLPTGKIQWAVKKFQSYLVSTFGVIATDNKKIKTINLYSAYLVLI